jgi:hypothetical protein
MTRRDALHSPWSQPHWPWLATSVTVLAALGIARLLGRDWHCWCGVPWIWITDAWGDHASQHLLDAYALTHVLHGFLFFWLVAWLLPRLPVAWQLWIAVAVESAWEVLENTNFVIERYRQATASVEYNGDTVVNVAGDILATGLGFFVARRLGFRLTLALFVLIEVGLLLWIRDSLLLTVWMLASPSEFLKNWQAGH